MKSTILIACLASSVSTLLLAESYTPGSEQDPKLRAAYFNAQTHKPFDALSEIASVAQKTGSYFSPSDNMKTAFQAAANELGLKVEDIGISPSVLRTPVDGMDTSVGIYRNYNLGISLLNTASPNDGIKILSDMSTSEFVKHDELLLKDKANLTLGYYFLEHDDNTSAANYFRSVRRLSPYANKALVGLGWALLSPRATSLKERGESSDSSTALAGNYLWSGSDDEVAWSRRDAPFRRAWAVAKGEKEQDLLAALVPWMELISRDPLDPAVQEVMLIIPYLMLHWDGQEARSQQYYVSAVARLKQARLDLTAIEQDIRSGGLLKSIHDADAVDDSGWDAWLSDLTANRLGGYLSLLIDRADFRYALTQYRQLNHIHARLQSSIDDRSSENIAVVRSVMAEIERHRSDWSTTLEKLALERIIERCQRTEAYSAEAEFALARNYERLHKQLSGVAWSESES